MVLIAAVEVRAQSPAYASLYDPFAVHSLHFEMDPADWTAIANDETRTIEKPAWFWADGESKMLVSMRRKGLPVTGRTATSLGKFGLKIDLNEYFGQNTWHGVK